MRKGTIVQSIVGFDEAGMAMMDDAKIYRCAWHDPVYRDDILYLAFHSGKERR